MPVREDGAGDHELARIQVKRGQRITVARPQGGGSVVRIEVLDSQGRWQETESMRLTAKQTEMLIVVLRASIQEDNDGETDVPPVRPADR